jgi:hypothetical protein
MAPVPAVGGQGNCHPGGNRGGIGDCPGWQRGRSSGFNDGHDLGESVGKDTRRAHYVDLD